MSLRIPPHVIPYRRALILGVQVAIIPLAYLAAFGLRFDFHLPAAEWTRFQTTVLYLVGVRLLAVQVVGLHRGYWSHVGLRDLRALVVAVTFSSVRFVVGLFCVSNVTALRRPVF